MIKSATQFSNQIRGMMKTFGLVVPKGGGRVFEGHVRHLLADDTGLEQIILPVLEALHVRKALHPHLQVEFSLSQMRQAVGIPGLRRGGLLASVLFRA